MSMRGYDPNSPCPCQASDAATTPLNECCGPYLSGKSNPATAEDLMRSRYSAYAIGDLEYIKQTWHPKTLPTALRLVPGQRWIELKIKRTEAGGVKDAHGIVEFVAKSKRNGRAHRMHEVSEFEKFNDQWVYVGGDYSTGQ